MSKVKDNMEWLEGLLRMARLKRMCEENREALSKCRNKAQAIALYKRTIDWALENHYPDMETLRRDFSEMDAMGVYVDKDFNGTLCIDHQVYVFHGCTGVIRVDLNIKKHIIPMIYVANGCKLDIIRTRSPFKSRIRVPIYVFGDDNEINAVDTENVKFTIYKMEVAK